MTILNTMTYNVRGLNTPIKRNNIIREIKFYKADVVLLQETHISQDSNLKIIKRLSSLVLWGFPNKKS